MKYIKKYIKFFETVAEPEVAKAALSKTTRGHEGEERTESDVVERLSRIYKGLPSDEKKKINSYFE